MIYYFPSSLNTGIGFGVLISGFIVILLEVISFTKKPSSDTEDSVSTGSSKSFLLRGAVNFIFAGLLYAAAVFSSTIYYIPASSMTIVFGLYLTGFLMKQEFKRSILTFYVMLATGAAFLG